MDNEKKQTSAPGSDAFYFQPSSPLAQRELWQHEKQQLCTMKTSSSL